MDCCNFELKGNKFQQISEEYENYKNSGDKGKIIHWLPKEEVIEVEVFLDNGQIINGFGEQSMKELNEGDIIQLERRYFARVDKIKKNKITLWQLHK